MNASPPEHAEPIRLRLAPDDRHPLADLLESKGFGYLAEQLRVVPPRRPVSWARVVITVTRRNGTTRAKDAWGVRCPQGYALGDVVEVRSRKGESKRVVLGDVIKHDVRGYAIRNWTEANT